MTCSSPLYDKLWPEWAAIRDELRDAQSHLDDVRDSHFDYYNANISAAYARLHAASAAADDFVQGLIEAMRAKCDV